MQRRQTNHYPKLRFDDAIKLLTAVGGLRYSFKRMCRSGPQQWAICQINLLGIFEYSEQPLVYGEHMGECLAKCFPELMNGQYAITERWNPLNYRNHKYVKPSV